MTMTCFDQNERRQWSSELCCFRFTLCSVNKVVSVKILRKEVLWFIIHSDVVVIIMMIIYSA